MHNPGEESSGVRFLMKDIKDKKTGSYLSQSEHTISENVRYSDIKQNHDYIVIDIFTNLKIQ